MFGLYAYKLTAIAHSILQQACPCCTRTCFRQVLQSLGAPNTGPSRKACMAGKHKLYQRPCHALSCSMCEFGAPIRGPLSLGAPIRGPAGAHAWQGSKNSISVHDLHSCAICASLVHQYGVPYRLVHPYGAQQERKACAKCKQ
jgi:hypothetical protein